MRPIQTVAAQAVHGKGGVRQELARMLPALHAAMRCLALSACLVFLIWCVCVIEPSVLSPAPRRRLQRLPQRWECTPRCRCIRCSIQPAASVRVSCACARFVGMFVHACKFCQAGVIKYKILCVCVLGPCFLCALDYFCNRVTCRSG